VLVLQNKKYIYLAISCAQQIRMSALAKLSPF